MFINCCFLNEITTHNPAHLTQQILLLDYFVFILICVRRTSVKCCKKIIKYLCNNSR
jgi:hypothetical protein